MTFTASGITSDGFLGGSLDILQPKDGYRAATDPVFLAASVPARPGQSVLELGCGVGVAMLCLGHRVPGLTLTGLEIQADYAELARENAKTNDIQTDVFVGDLMKMPRALLDENFDHVMFNPPFYDVSDVSAPKNAGKSQAHVMDLGIEDWIKTALRRLKPKGRLTLIHRVDVLPKALGCLAGEAGDITVKPLTSRQHQSAKRIIVTCRKGTNGPPKLLPPLVIHQSGAHSADEGAYSTIAESVLRCGEALTLDK